MKNHSARKQKEEMEPTEVQNPASAREPKRKSARLQATFDGDQAKIPSPFKCKPDWAETTSKADSASAIHGFIVSAVDACVDKSTKFASLDTILKHFKSNYLTWTDDEVKAALKSTADQGLIQLLEDQDAYKLMPKTQTKVAPRRSASVASKETLADLIPHVFAWINEPKRSTQSKIKMYIQTNFPFLSVEGTAFTNALDLAIQKGQLKKTSGDVFELVDNADKTGGAFEDAIEDAIIATSEPKVASFKELVAYFSNYHKEFGVGKNKKILADALDQTEKEGWIVPIQDKKNSFQLGHHYTPSPQSLWRDEYDEDEYKAGSSLPKPLSKTPTPKKNQGKTSKVTQKKIQAKDQKGSSPKRVMKKTMQLGPKKASVMKEKTPSDEPAEQSSKRTVAKASTPSKPSEVGTRRTSLRLSESKFLTSTPTRKRRSPQALSEVDEIKNSNKKKKLVSKNPPQVTRASRIKNQI